MLINELSKRTGITAHTIRFYEKSGLIKGAKSIGFTISEIGNLIDAWYNKKLSTEEKLSICDEKLLSIENKIKELKQMQKLLNQLKKNIVSSKC